MKRIKIGTIVFLLMIIIILGIVNFITNGEFWKASFYEIITLIIALVVTYIFSELNSKEVKRREILERMLENVQDIINQPKYYKLRDTDEKDLSMMKRTINNKLSLINQELKNDKTMNEKIKYIIDNFNDYRSLIDEHLNDREYLEKSENELRKKLLLIDDKIDEIKLKLYMN